MGRIITGDCRKGLNRGSDMKPKWEKQEKGWWIHEKIGGIVQEKDNYWYIYKKEDDSGFGPFKSLKKAQARAELMGERDEKH